MLDQPLDSASYRGYDLKPRGEHVWQAWDANLRVSEKILSCVVFIGIDEHGPFVPLGTGFLGYVTTDGFLFQQIVTARHVIEPIEAKRICIRINTRDGRVEHTYTLKSDWEFHPDEKVDIAVCPSHTPPERYDVAHIHLERELVTPELITEETIGVGDDIFMAGMFTRHLGEQRNRPIVRTGTIAAMADEKVSTSRGMVDAYLVEARSIAGLSGSPVFVHMAPLRVLPGGQVSASKGRIHYFLGVMQGHYVTKDPTDVASPDVEVPGDMSTGIGVVVPGEKVLEVVNLDKFKSQREAIVAKKKAETGFVDDSAKQEPPTMDENPRHKEDFNSLLGAAVRKPRQDDQT